MQTTDTNVQTITELIDEFRDAVGSSAVDEIVRRFDNFNTKNALMIAMQRPDATDVRKYPDWLMSGRKVKHGEKGIRLIMGKDVVSVFDVSQTEELRK